MWKEAGEPIWSSSFEVAEHDPTPPFESQSLCGVFDVMSECARASVLMCTHLIGCHILLM